MSTKIAFIPQVYTENNDLQSLKSVKEAQSIGS